jgi:hypothetical protein
MSNILGAYHFISITFLFIFSVLFGIIIRNEIIKINIKMDNIKMMMFVLRGT